MTRPPQIPSPSPPPTPPQIDGTRPIDRHRDNVARLGPRDVPITGYPGSGISLLGNILLELGLDVIDPHTETVADDGTATPVARWSGYRHRLAATARRDHHLDHGVDHGSDHGGDPHHRVAGSTEPRFFKNHLPPTEVRPWTRAGAVLLVRDPRDTLYSAFHWYRSFGPAWGSVGAGCATFADFLTAPALGGHRPLTGWVRMCRAWLEVLDQVHPSRILRFEDLKSDPTPVVATFLTAFGVARSAEEITAACHASSFAQMRRHEDQVAGDDPGRLMRRGLVGEWRDWFDQPELARHFADEDLRALAARLGYRIDTDSDTDIGTATDTPTDIATAPRTDRRTR